MVRVKATAFGVLLAAGSVVGLGQKQCVTLGARKSFDHDLIRDADSQGVFAVSSHHAEDQDSFLIASSKPHSTIALVLDPEDDIAVHLAAKNLALDIGKVIDNTPKLYNSSAPDGTDHVVLIGTIGSKLVQDLQLDYTKEMEGQWESFDMRIVGKNLVITGSDRRGTVFGVYDFSEQIGISPWYFWNDVVAPKHESIGWEKDAVCSHGPPTVKYRGIFINDETPVLWSWARDYFGYKNPESPFQVELYEKVFEMILRMKGNFFWPAKESLMEVYISMFDVDGFDWRADGIPKQPTPGPNQVLAHQMGVVMGSSHHEPMARNKPEWDWEGKGDWDWRTNEDKLTEWWTYGAERAVGCDTLFTLGMRGDGDSPLQDASKELLQEIAGAQQGMLKKAYKTDNLKDVPQLWAMYKEVQAYYLDGLEVPDDITVLFADDNWGNVMSVLPPGTNHTGGGGIYYHVDYVGSPTQYKWINTINLAKTWEQMNIARSFDTTQVWIVNVGDIKHHELPAEHFLSLAYDFDRWDRTSTLPFLTLWANREFGGHHAEEIADIMIHYSMYVARLKPELYNAQRFSCVNYEEAERILDQWTNLAAHAEKVFKELPKEHRQAFYEYCLTPITLVTNANELYLSTGWNNLHSGQSRTSTNRYAEKALAALQIDHNITEHFHHMLDGKWKNILAQPHLNQQYFTHQLRDTTPPLNWIQEDVAAWPRYDGVNPAQPYNVRYTLENSMGAYPGHNYYNCARGYGCGGNPALLRMDPYGAKTRWVDVAAGGPMDTTWTAKPNTTILRVSKSEGSLKKDGTTDSRVYISIDWDQVPAPAEGEDVYHGNATIEFSASDGSNMTLIVPYSKPRAPQEDFHGHVQGDGYVVIEAGHFARNHSKDGYAFEEIPWYGRTHSGVEMYPTTDKNFTIGEGPVLEYDWWATGQHGIPKGSWDGKVNVTIQIGPTFNFIPFKQIAFGFQMDDGETHELYPVPAIDVSPEAQSTPMDWYNVVSTEIRNVTLSVPLENSGKPAKHTARIFGKTAGVIVERMWFDFGGIADRGYSFLGPPESYRV